jgi:hypothetical protein
MHGRAADQRLGSLCESLEFHTRFFELLKDVGAFSKSSKARMRASTAALRADQGTNIYAPGTDTRPPASGPKPRGLSSARTVACFIASWRRCTRLRPSSRSPAPRAAGPERGRPCACGTSAARGATRRRRSCARGRRAATSARPTRSKRPSTSYPRARADRTNVGWSSSSEPDSNAVRIVHHAVNSNRLRRHLRPAARPASLAPTPAHPLSPAGYPGVLWARRRFVTECSHPLDQIVENGFVALGTQSGSIGSRRRR